MDHGKTLSFAYADPSLFAAENVEQVQSSLKVCPSNRLRYADLMGLYPFAVVGYDGIVGGFTMKLDRFLFLMFSTVFLGAIVGILASASGIWIHVYWFTGLIEGGFLATTSLMGFWAYLTMNFIARMTVPRRVWVWAQLLVIALVTYDMLGLRYQNVVAFHPHHHAPYSTFFVQGLWPLVVALVAAIVKRRMSGKGSYIPTVFYLYVFTVVDWLLVIWFYTGPIANETGIVMMACNIYLILMLGKLLTKRPEPQFEDEPEAIASKPSQTVVPQSQPQPR